MSYLLENHPFPLMRNLKILGIVLFVFIGVGAQVSASSSNTSLWDLNFLNKPPKMIWLNNHNGIQFGNVKIYGLFYQGQTYKGKATGVFAYYATPGSISGNPTLDKNLPGVILIHEGLGHAESSWVINWARLGYAALAMDLSGCGPDQKPLPNSTPIHAIDDYTDYDLNYHMVGNTILAHSLLLSFKEVNIDRTAVIGIGVGGQITCIVASIDKRFKAAVPIYGCGYLHENSRFSDKLSHMEKNQRDQWIKQFDPSSYLGSVTIPMLFITGTKDQFYPMDSYVKTLQLCKGMLNLCIHPEIEHSMSYGIMLKEPYLFINQYGNGGAPLHSIEKPQIVEGQVRAKFQCKTKPIRATLHYTTDTCAFKDRIWNSIDATIVGSTISSPKPPENASAWLLTLEDERNATISSEVIF
jgi:pimeloyl-ACP methyl ester carboxylesterase